MFINKTFALRSRSTHHNSKDQIKSLRKIKDNQKAIPLLNTEDQIKNEFKSFVRYQKPRYTNRSSMFTSPINHSVSNYVSTMGSFIKLPGMNQSPTPADNNFFGMDSTSDAKIDTSSDKYLIFPLKQNANNSKQL